MSRWYTSDHHFGHQNIIRYCDRPFSDAEHMGWEMVARWNDAVEDSDEVWILGDLAMGQLQESLSTYVAQLKGRKILVPGNHDRCWMGRKVKANGNADAYIAYRDDYYHVGGIAKVVDRPEPHTIAGHTVRIDHFPYKFESPYDLKYSQWRPDDDGSWLLHGHIHEKWQQKQRQINVGVDAWDFAPVSEDTIAEVINRGPVDEETPAAARRSSAI